LFLGAVKRCYKCRSRGELGDCRNPFVNDLGIDGSTRRPTTRNPFSSNFNDDLFQRGSSSNSHGVEAVPCSSGWCAKVIEGKGTFKADGKLIINVTYLINEEKDTDSVNHEAGSIRARSLFTLSNY